MLLKNVVLIKTIEGTGTGLIYPCYYNNLKNTFIVITNSHVLTDVAICKDIDFDYKDDIVIQFYDDLGDLIDRDDIETIYLFKEDKYTMDEDIAALLVVLKKNLLITLEKKIFDKSIENREKIFLEGYPGVMLNDNIYQKIQLEGQAKSMFPKNKNIGIYQIIDDYHWYNNFNDKKIIEGLSGSPVYFNKNGKILILGISQSISDIFQGENPFKIIYYLKMENVLDYLRKNNCIIYSKVSEFEYKIVWTLNKTKDKIENNFEEINIMMIGSSGSGKSTFAKNFAYYGNKLNSSNDGQTTRTNIIYEYSLFKYNDTKQEINIQLLNKNNFVKQMINRLEFSFFKKMIKNNLDLVDESTKNEQYFLNNVQILLQIIWKIKKEEIESLIYKIWIILRGEIDNELKLSVYEELIIILKKNIKKNFLKYIIDENYLEISINKSEDYICKELDKETDKEAIKILEELKDYYRINGKLSIDKFKQFQEQIIKTKNQINKEKLNYSITEDLLRSEGYFEIEEFYNIFPKESEFKKNIEQFIKQFSNEKNIMNLTLNKEKTKLKVGKNTLKLNKSKELKGLKYANNLKFIINTIYGNIYQKIIDEIKKNFQFKEKNKKYEKSIDISNMSKEEQSLVEKCLQVTKNGSLTGIIDYVKIQDRISNEYAMIMFELGIKKINIIDTCGFDHIESDNKNMIKTQLLKNLYNTEKRYNKKQYKPFSYSEINILYFKKLDSGKPDELRYMIPSIKETIPAAPVYCFFTGIDIFYKTEEEIKSYSWKNESEKNPKAINYILSKKGYNDLNSIKSYDNMYLTLKNNLIGYCGLKELEISNFQIYNNNINGIRKILTSISMKEYSSLEIIDIARGVISNKMEKEIEKLIEELFLKASIHNKYYRWNTKKADISGRKTNEFGYRNTYNHFINTLFHEAFAEIINDSELIGTILEKEEFKNTKNAVYASLKNLENKFIGNYLSLTSLDENNTHKNEFRNIMERMYESDKYAYNPYQTDPQKDKYITEDLIKDKRDEIFKDIFDFKKGLSDKSFLENFRDLFVKCLEEQIRIDNMKKSKNMINLNQEFVEKLSELKYDFIEKYSVENNNNAEQRFKQLMSFYFKL